MSVRFFAIKRERAINTIIKSCLYAFACGLSVAGLIMLISKLAKADINVLYVVLSGVLTLIVSASVLLLIFYPRTKSLAKEIDNKYLKNERMQTTLELMGSKDEFAELQRNDTEQRLKTVPKEVLTFKSLLTHIVSVAVGIAILLVGILIPQKSDNNNSTVPEPYIKTEFQVLALSGLIDDVKNSKMENELKDIAVNELSGLLNVLDTITLKSQLKEKIVEIVVNIDDAVEINNTYKSVAIALDKSKNEYLCSIAKMLLTLSGIGTGQEMVTVSEKIMLDEQSKTFSEKISAFSKSLNESTISYATSEDRLEKCLFDYAQNINQIDVQTKESVISIDEAKEQLKVQTGVIVVSLNEAITQQFENNEMRKTINSKLLQIFEFSDSILPKLKCDTIPALEGGSGSSQGGNEQENSGGLGGGDNIYGSNDIVFDPYQEGGGAYISYGEAFDKYYKKIEELLLDGELSEADKQALSKYFTELSNGAKGEETD